jgi:hypothetical protein
MQVFTVLLTFVIFGCTDGALSSVVQSGEEACFSFRVPKDGVSMIR